MIEYSLKKEWLEEAESLYDFKCLRDSVTKGEGNRAGAVGEILIKEHFRSKGADVQFRSCKDYDMVIDGGLVDVKSFKLPYIPKPSKKVNVFATSRHQKCEYYFFVCVMATFETAYLLGWKEKKDFFRESTLMKKGQKSLDGTFIHKADDYVLPIEELKPFKGD